MSETATRIPALCCECGMRREVSASWAVQGGSGNRRLKCATCQTATMHAAVRDDPDRDWREWENARAGAGLLELVALTDFLGTMGVWVTDGDPHGGQVDIRRYLDGTEPAWRVVLSQDLSVADRVRMLEWAWATMLPKARRWGDVCEDEYGEYRGHYRT